jgi:ribosomal protein L24E
MNNQTTTITLYPTGCFMISHEGNSAYWWSSKEKKVHAKLAEMGVDPRNVKWTERYYDSDYPPNHPLNYRQRDYTPKESPVLTAYQKLMIEHDRLKEAVQLLKDAKGRHNNQKAAEQLFTLIESLNQ